MLASRRSRLATALAAAAVLTGAGASAVPAAPADPAAAPPPAAAPGAAGIGDPYFPLDGNGGIDVRRYEVHVGYDFDEGRLHGWTRLTLRPTRDLTRFNLDLLLPVRSVRIDGRPAAFRKPEQHELQITPRRPLREGRTVRVVVAYDGHPGPIAYAGERNWLAGPTEVVAMNQPHMAPWWFPANDHPRDRARVDVHVTVPRAMDVVANGTRVGRTVDGPLATTHWRSRDAMAPYLAFFAAGRYATDQGTRDGLPWFVAVSRDLAPGQQRRAMRLMRRTPAITAWLERRLGGYPFESTGGLTTALSPGFALENQTRPTYPVLSRDAGLVVVHELAHQWFGDSVTVHGWRDIWLNEGPATLFEVLWAEAHGGPTGQAWLDQSYADVVDNDYFWQVRVDDPGAQRIFDTPVYQRGGMTLVALRTRIGSADFGRLLRTWVQSKRGTTGSTPEFEALAEQISGEDLDGFFQAWLRAPEPPARTAANGFAS